MANITVSSTSNLDDVANQNLLHSNTITINNGAVLTIDSDNRWSQQAAIFGAISVSSNSQGGTLKLDGTKTWWLPFDGSSGQHELTLTSAQYYDAPSYTDQTTEANDTTANDLTLLPAVPAVNDAYYFGHNYQFTRLWLNIGTAGAGTWTITWEYWNGSAWTALSNVRDDTSSFKPSSTGWKMVQFSVPANWTTYAVNGVTTYWIRARVSAYTSITTRPLGTQARISTLGMTLNGAGGASGEIIGIWDTMGAAPVHGNSTSATGWFKLRSKTGSFVDNEALSINGSAYNGALVNSATGGQRGWIHIVGNKSTTSIFPYGGLFQVRGDWFYVGQTNGTRRQTLQLPVGDYFAGVWIETAPSSGEYVFWPSANGVWDAAKMPTDARGKFVEITSTGLLRIGGTAAGADCGVLPVSGCNIRIPNVIFGTSSSANWDVNYWDATVGEHHILSASGGGRFDIDRMAGTSCYLYPVLCTSFNMVHSCFLSVIGTSDLRETSVLDDIHVSFIYNGVTGYNSTTGGLSGTSIKNLQVKNSSFWRYGPSVVATNYCVSIATALGGILQFLNCTSGYLDMRINAGSYYYTCSFGGFGELEMSDCKTVGAMCQIASNIIRVNNHIHADRLYGATDATNPTNCIYVNGCEDCVISGLSFYPGITDSVAPYSYLFSTLSVNGLRVRNIGTKSSPLDLGAKTAYIFIQSTQGYDGGLKGERIYLTNGRSTMWFFSQATSENASFVNCSRDLASELVGTLLYHSHQEIYKGFFGGGNALGRFGNEIPVSFSGIFGTHFWDAFHSSTRGKIGLFFTPKTSDYPSSIAYEITSGNPTFSLSGSLYAITSGDAIVYTWPHYILGYTGFTSDAVQINGTNVSGGTYGFGKHRVRYQLDKNDGNGFGEWKECTAANLSAETGISPTLGFKPKFEISCIETDTTNAINGFYVFGATDATSQLVQYPFSEIVRIQLLGIVPGSSYILRDVNGNVLAEKYHSAIANEEIILEVPSESPSDEVYITAEIRKGSGTPNYEPFETAGYVSFLNPLKLTILQRLDSANP